MEDHNGVRTPCTMISLGRPFSRLASVPALLLAFAPFCMEASTFDIGLDGKSPYPEHSCDQILELQRNSDGRMLLRDELDAFKTVLVEQGWPTYRTSGPGLIDAAGKLLERSGLDCEFQKYMLRVLDQQVGDDIRPAIHARLADRIHASHNSSQLYGTLQQRLDDVATVDPPVASLGSLLFFRDFYGLPSLEEDLASGGIDYEVTLSQPPATYTWPDIRTLLGELIQPDQSLRAALSAARSKGVSAKVELLKEEIAASDRPVKDQAGIRRRRLSDAGHGGH